MQRRLMPGGDVPHGNKFPTSLHIMKGLIRCADADRYQHHVCVNDCMRFKDLERMKWAAHKDEQCTHCHEARFIAKVGANNRLLLRPRKVAPTQPCMHAPGRSLHACATAPPTASISLFSVCAPCLSNCPYQVHVHAQVYVYWPIG